MNSELVDITAIVVFGLGMLLIGLWFGNLAGTAVVRGEAVKRGYAQWTVITNDLPRVSTKFEWKQ